MLNEDDISYVPKYVQIQNYILQKIKDGILSEGDRIPSEAGLQSARQSRNLPMQGWWNGFGEKGHMSCHRRETPTRSQWHLPARLRLPPLSSLFTDRTS